VKRRASIILQQQQQLLIAAAYSQPQAAYVGLQCQGHAAKTNF